MKKLSIILLTLTSCGKFSNVKDSSYEIVDSVWTIEPGNPYPFQTDQICYARTKSGKITARKNKEFSVGDTLKIYRLIKP